jgi:hypothetical protein
MMECVDNYPCTDDEADNNDFDIEDYMQCTQLEVNNNNDRRQLEEGDGNAIYYYVGPYCAKQGGSVYLGLFTDNACTEFATVTFESLTGFEMPYDGKSIIDEECL